MELLMSEEASITTQQIPFGHVQGNPNTSQNLLQLSHTHTHYHVNVHTHVAFFVAWM